MRSAKETDFSTTLLPEMLKREGPPGTLNMPSEAGLIEATSNCDVACANAMNLGASAPAKTHPSSATALTATRLMDARGENTRPRSSSISIRSLSRDLGPNTPSASSSLVRGFSVRIRLLRMIDDDSVKRSHTRFQLQPELLLNRREERRAARIRGRGIGKLDFEIVSSRKPRLVKDGTARKIELAEQVRHGRMTGRDPI